MRAHWCVGIVGMSIRLRRGLRTFCCRITWFEWEDEMGFGGFFGLGAGLRRRERDGGEYRGEAGGRREE